MLLGTISSWDWGSGLSFFRDFLHKFGPWICDLLNMVFWGIIHAFASICDGIYSVVLFIISPDAIGLFTSESTISKFYTFSYILGFLLVLLFTAWQILKRNIEPDKAPPVSSIVWECGKCLIIITMFLMIFNTSFGLVTAVQETLPKIYSSSKTIDENGNVSYQNNNEDTKFSSYIISSFIELPENEKDFTKEDLIESLNRKSGSCNEKGVSFWGCEFTNYSSGGKTKLYFDPKSKYRLEVDLNKIKDDNASPAPMYNWRESFSTSILTDASFKKGYSFSTNYILLFVSLIVFTIVFFFTAFSLVTRLFELLILLIVGPAVIGSTVCKQETRITLWKTLAGLLLQSLGTLLTIYLALSIMSTINSMDVPTAFAHKPLTYMLLKCVLIFGLGTFMVGGSKVINAFVSETAGIKDGFMGGIATVAAGIGLAKLAAGGAGLALKGVSGADSAKNAIRTKNAERKLNKAKAKYVDGKANAEKVNKAQANLNKAREKGSRYTTDANGNRVRKNSLANNASYLGDRLLGKSKKDIAEEYGNFENRNGISRSIGMIGDAGKGVINTAKGIGDSIDTVADTGLKQSAINAGNDLKTWGNNMYDGAKAKGIQIKKSATATKNAFFGTKEGKRK